MRNRFGPQPDIRNITSFLAGIRTTKNEGSAAGFPYREAEAMIRAVLGEVFLLDSVHPGKYSYPEIGITVVTGFLEEGRLSLNEWESLLKRAQLLVENGFELAPELAFAEDDWFGCLLAE